MSDSYHINPDTGRANKCSAKIRCRFGTDAKHYDSKESAQKAYESSMSSGKISQGLKKASKTIAPTPISDEMAESLEIQTRAISGGVVGISPGIDFGDPNTIMGVSFSCEHDLYLIIENDENGDKLGYVFYGYDPTRKRLPLDEVLTPSNIYDLAGENPNYPFDLWEDDRDTHTAGVEVVKIVNDSLKANGRV